MWMPSSVFRSSQTQMNSLHSWEQDSFTSIWSLPNYMPSWSNHIASYSEKKSRGSGNRSIGIPFPLWNEKITSAPVFFLFQSGRSITTHTPGNAVVAVKYYRTTSSKRFNRRTKILNMWTRSMCVYLCQTCLALWKQEIVIMTPPVHGIWYKLISLVKST